ncbi:sulfatase [Halorarum salinum]|uniref:Sulfatase-like hydrolase/transferase n=1 Tax=Halorarum salinum TaxID=2743089 RepID=A0A7D5L935_9EURY|nr:sulfatase [Halobaculum salinum]QLG61093.1 sulfatase-like hydrolase/transferase [Halobaculum salinum]
MSNSTPNVLYITIDSIRADRVGFVGEQCDTTPVMDGLAGEGTTFEYAIATGIPTYYSFKSLLGGINSLSHEEGIGLPDTVTSIPEVFRGEGYSTAGFNAKNPWLTKAYGYDRGFDMYRDFLSEDDSRINTGQITRELKRFAKRAVSFSDTLTDRLGRLGRITNAVLGSQPLMPAEPLTDAASDWLETRSGDGPFFLWVHYMDPHYPWIPPAEFLPDDSDEKLSRLEIGQIWHTVAHEYKKENASVDSETIAQIEQLYDAEIRRTDAAIGRLVSALREQNEFEDTLIAIVGDHGTELYDHGGFSHGPDTLYQEIIRVPLLFHGPGVDHETRNVAALVDVPQTIIDTVTGIKGSPESFEGIDLLEEQRLGVSTEVVYDYDPALGENVDNDVFQARTEPPWKLIRNQHTGSLELYHLEDDPGEHEPVHGEYERQSTLESELDSHREFIQRRNRTVAEKQRVRRRIAELREAGKI